MSLQRQLTRNFTLVALAGLLLASIVGALLVRTQQTRAAERSVALITNIVAARAQNDALPPDAPQLERVVEAAGGRLLLVNAPDGAVLSDSVEGEGSLVGEQLPVRALFAAARQAQRPAIRQARFDGTTYYLSIVPVRPLSDRDRLVIAIPSATVLESWLTLLPGILLVSGLGMVLAWSVGRRMSQKVTEPLAAVNGAASKMAAGDYDARVSTTSDIPELQTLATTFNSMADEVKDARQVQRDFLANVSHDLRTPLTSIQGFSQAMMDGAVPAEQQHRVASIIYSEAGRLTRLVQDLLDLARIEAGRFSMNRRDLNLKEVLTQVRETFAPQAERAGVALEMKLPSRALPLYADSDRLAQVFGNLIDNAITYAQQGGKQVRVSASLGGIRDLRGHGATAVSKEAAPASPDVAEEVQAPHPVLEALHDGAAAPVAATLNGSNGAPPAGSAPEAEPEQKLGRWWVEVQIADDGPGIEYDQQARVFERFHRGDSARGGVGLGLAIVKEIIEAHGGDITVEDNAPQGTLFVVRLPMKMW